MNDPHDHESSESPGIIELDLDFDTSSLVSDAFYKESEEILSDLDEHISKLESFPHDQLLLQALFRKIHTLKGSAGAVPGGQLFGSLAHEFEALLETLRRQKIPPSQDCCALFLHSSRLLKVLAENLRSQREIYPEELSEVIELISRYGNFQPAVSNSEPGARAAIFENTEPRERNTDGLWISKEQMSALLQISSEFITLKNSDSTEKQEMVQKLHLLSGQLQNFIDHVQKIKLQDVFAGLFPLARQAAYELRKEVELKAEGLDVEVDKFLAQDLYKSLIHMIRNGLDHGIETPEERVAAGKSPSGRVEISIYEKSSFLFCEITDDGRGIDCQKLVERALEKGLINSLTAAQLSEEQILAFIFHPGFSTKQRVTTMSGRGVGMDVVQATVQKYNGTIKVDSVPGHGCSIHLKIPVPKALLVERCLITVWNGLSLAFPLMEVSTIGTVEGMQITDIHEQRFCQAEGRTTPLLTLHEIYNQKTSMDLEKVQQMSVVFIKFEEQTLGILVDTVQHQVDLVIKPMSPFAKRSPGIKGSSLLNNDLIGYVIDPGELISLVKRTAV